MPQTTPHPTPPSSWLHRTLGGGVLWIAFVLSILLHAALVGILALAAFLELPFMMQFEQSAGIGIMSRIGQQLSTSEILGAPRYTQVLDLTPPAQNLGPAKPTAEEQQQIEEAIEEIEQAEALRQAEAAAQQEREEKEAQEARRQRRAERQARKEKEAVAEAEAEAAKQQAANAQKSSENATTSETAANTTSTGDANAAAEQGLDGKGEPNKGPRLDLPPADRYPQGTINPVATDLGMWGPEGARLVVVIRNDRLRGSSHAQSVRDVLDSFPDWRTLVGGAELDPLNDIDTTLIASANPKYINQTFLAAMHHLPAEQVVGVLSHGEHQGVTWREEKGRIYGDFEARSGVDPRQFFIPTDGVFVLSRPEFLKDLENQAPTPEGLDAAIAFARLSKDEQQKQLARAQWKQPAPEPRSVTRKPPRRKDGWLRGIIEVADYGGTDRNGPVAMVSTGKISNMRIQGYQGTMPQSMHANIYDGKDVRITGRMIFKKQSEAEALKDAWPQILASNRASLNLTGLYRPLADAELTIDHNELVFAFVIPNATMKRLGVSVSQLMQMR